MIKYFTKITYVFLILINSVIYCQNILPEYKIEMGTYVNFNDTTPFWLASKQYGKNSSAGSSIYYNISLIKKIKNNNFLDYGYGLSIYQKFINNNEFYFDQTYAIIKIWKFNLTGGKKYELFGNADSTLSSGNILWSGNSRAMPKISFGTNNYVTVPFTKDYLEIKAIFSHGWFEKNRYVDNIWLHHKNLYGKLGGKLPVNIHFGLEHFAQWAGESPDTAYGELPDNLDAYWKVIRAEYGDSDKVNINEATNRLGNHIGSYNAGIDIKIKNLKTSIYWQSIFEDKSGKKLYNFPDGLYGISFKLNKKKFPISGILYEFFYSMDQSGPEHIIEEGQTGNDNYFNHGIYRNGWTYHGFTIGTPFITSPIYNQNNNINILNNRIKAHHFGLKGEFNKIQYLAFITYSINYGTHSSPYITPKNNLSVLMDISMPVKIYTNLELNAKLGFDIGKMYGKNLGFIISLIKTDNFKIKKSI